MSRPDTGPGRGKRIYASRDIGAPSFGVASETDPTMRLAATMANQLIIDKPSYAECLDRMAQIWRNWDRGNQEQARRNAAAAAVTEATRREITS